MIQELVRLSADQFVALILDNEVTVGEFVATPPLSWTRLVQRNGIFQVAEGYPTVLTVAQAKVEMKNWDEVSLPAIMRWLEELDDAVGLCGLRQQRGARVSACSKPAAALDRQPRSDHLRKQPAGEKRIREARLSNLLSEERGGRSSSRTGKEHEPAAGSLLHQYDSTQRVQLSRPVKLNRRYSSFAPQ